MSSKYLISFSPQNNLMSKESRIWNVTDMASHSLLTTCDFAFKFSHVQNGVNDTYILCAMQGMVQVPLGVSYSFR